MLEVVIQIYAFLLGASLASFLVVVGERGYKKLSINGRSKCICGRQLTWWENIPIISYLILKGVARCCKSKIPKYYLITEISLASTWLLAANLPQKAGLVIIVVATLLTPLNAYRVAKARSRFEEKIYQQQVGSVVTNNDLSSEQISENSK